MRGRLIRPFLAKIARLDTAATAADTGVTGYPSGYDPVFKEPVRLPDGTSARKEHPQELIPCQIEVISFEKLHEMGSGDDPEGTLTLVFHFADLEDLNLLDSGGASLIRKGTRLVSVHRYDDESLIQQCGRDGYFCTESQPQSFGLLGAERNLLLCTFTTRDNSAKNAGVGG